MSSKNVRILADAQFEIEEAFERYRQDSPRIADRLLKEIRSSLKKIWRTRNLSPVHEEHALACPRLLPLLGHLPGEARDHSHCCDRSWETARRLLGQASETVASLPQTRFPSSPRPRFPAIPPSVTYFYGTPRRPLHPSL